MVPENLHVNPGLYYLLMTHMHMQDGCCTVSCPVVRNTLIQIRNSGRSIVLCDTVSVTDSSYSRQLPNTNTNPVSYVSV